jgi:hypothetical protein
VEGNGIRRRARRTDVPKIVDWYMEGKIEIDPMITHTMPLADINKGFDLMHEGKSIRSVVSCPVALFPASSEREKIIARRISLDRARRECNSCLIFLGQ